MLPFVVFLSRVCVQHSDGSVCTYYDENSSSTWTTRHLVLPNSCMMSERLIFTLSPSSNLEDWTRASSRILQYRGRWFWHGCCVMSDEHHAICVPGEHLEEGSGVLEMLHRAAGPAVTLTQHVRTWKPTSEKNQLDTLCERDTRKEPRALPPPPAQLK